MYLIFTDESGTNKDSNIVLYGGVAISENNLIKSEMIISDIAKEFFDIDNILEIEIHFVDIFNYVFYSRMPSKKNKQKIFKEKIIPLLENIKLDQNKLSLFIRELFQFLAKVDATFLVSVLKRNNRINSDAYVFKTFLNLADTFLNEKNEYGVLIADGFYNQINKREKNLNLFSENIDINTICSKKEFLFKRVLFESVSWRQRIDIEDNFIFKYKFESKIYNIFSNILFMPSNESHLIQISDILLYIMKKYIEFKLFNIKNLEVFFNHDFHNTFNYAFFKNNIKIATFKNEDINSVNLDALLNILRDR